MARFLLTVWPFSGHLHPMLSVAQALRARGHEVGIYSGEAAREVVEGEACTFFPFVSLAAKLHAVVDGDAPYRAGCDDGAFYLRLIDRYAAAYEYEGLKRVHLLKRMCDEWILGTVPQQVDDLQSVINCWHPDAVLCDPTLWAPYMVMREMLRVPVAVFSFFGGCMIPGRDTPPPGLGLPRPRDWRTRFLSWTATEIQNLVMADMRRNADVLRGYYGLPPLREPIAALSGRVPLHIVASAPEYDYNRSDLPPSVHYVGACLWDRPHHVPEPDWLRGLPRERPILYVSEGTAQVQPSTLLPLAARAFGDLPVEVILTVGSHRDPRALGLDHVAPNIRVERFIPHSALFPHLSAVVTNGGSGTVRAALAHGVPLVVVPRAWDQFDNAQRVVEAGAGLRLSARRCTVERLRNGVRRVLHEPSFADNACRLGIASTRCGGPARAASLLEALAGSLHGMVVPATAEGS